MERNWPPALKEAGAWSLASLRQSFLNGTLTRLVDPDAILRNKIVQFVSNGDFGLGSGRKADGTYERVWFKDLVAPDEVAFEAGVFLLRKATAGALKTGAMPEPGPEPGRQRLAEPAPPPEPGPEPGIQTKRIPAKLTFVATDSTFSRPALQSPNPARAQRSSGVLGNVGLP